MDLNDEVSDTTGDAIKYKAGYIKIPLTN